MSLNILTNNLQVNAIQEGRRTFDNIQKFVLHLLTSNVGEVVLLICGLGFQDDNRFSVFPLSPLQILWINMVTSSFPAFGLGREKASYNIMIRPPHDNRKGVFTWQIVTDMIVYGLLMGMLCLFTFVIIVYGPGNGNLGFDCNKTYSDSCEVVFRARAAVFAELTWLILISAWEFKSIRRSMFSLDPTRKDRGILTWCGDVWENKFLFLSVVVGAMIVFPCIYIPKFNTVVFKHKGLTWEWGLVVGALFLFVLGMEAWKLVKRTTGWFAAMGEDRNVDLERGSVGGLKRTKSALSLRQGFFSFAKASTWGSGETKVGGGKGETGVGAEDRSSAEEKV
jgi:P-type Na+/K+ transporter